MKNSAYWKRRMEILEEARNTNVQVQIHRLEKQYKIAQNNIEREIAIWYERFAENNQITIPEAKKMLFADELKEFRWNVEEYIKYGKENALNQNWMKELENASTRVHISRLEALNFQMQHQIEVLYGTHFEKVGDVLKDVYSNDYFHTAYEIQKGFNIGWDLHNLNNNELNKLLSKPWTTDRKTFSDRIWTNKQKLIGNLRTQLTQSVITGKAPKELIKNISEQMKVDRYKAGRLIMTESAAFASASQKDCFNTLGVEKFEIVATLDSHTSEICQNLDGHVFDMKDYEIGVTAPPFHVWCRTVTAPYFADNYGVRAAKDKDGKTYYVSSNMKYDDWKKSFIDNGSKDGLKELDNSVKIKTLFEDAKTIKEAEDYARNILGIPNVSYKGVDVETANRWNEGLKDSFERFPELKNNFGFVGECHERNKAVKPVAKQYYLDALKQANPNIDVTILEPYADKKISSLMHQLRIDSSTFAESWSPNVDAFKTFSGVTVNNNWGKDSSKFIKALIQNVESKYHPIGCSTIRSVLDHEIGHQLDNLLEINKKPEIRKLLTLRTNAQLTNDLSSYAWNNGNKNVFSELVAEGWAEYCNNPNPREIAKIIGETIEQEYKIKFGGI